VAQVPEPRDLAAIVAPHVAPDLAGAIMTEATVKLDVELPLLEDHVEMLGAIVKSGGLPPAGRQPVAPSEPSITDLKRRMRARSKGREEPQ
jgi:hypothetical protein